MKWRYEAGLLQYGQEKEEAIQKDQSSKDKLRHWSAIFSIAERNHVFSRNCLRSSLALRAMLAKKGITTMLRVGAKKSDDNLEAHAWLERQGEVIYGDLSDLQDYRIFPRMER